ncbi:MAG TPA: chemotaxis protein CheX [Desulfuromonadales bacterium]|nr:chemotaxis protein CheX [Desulfuromonadales bacterium]
MDLQKNITDATTEIFETMIMMEITPGDPLKELVTTFHHTVSGMVGLAGTFKGLLAIHTPNDVAKAITSNFLGLDVGDIDDDVKDAIGELANMLAGNIKQAIDTTGKDVTLSIPSAVHGEEYTLNCLANAEWMIMPFTTPSGEFLVELQFEKA